MGMQRGMLAVLMGACLVVVGAGPAAAQQPSAAGASERVSGTAAAGARVTAAARVSAGAVVVTRSPLRGTSWRAVLLRDEAGRLFWVRTSAAPTMRFVQRAVRGRAGCNRYVFGTRFTRSGGLKIRGGLITTAGCGGVWDTTESAFVGMTERVRSFERHGRSLTLRGKHGATLAVLRRTATADR